MITFNIVGIGQHNEGAVSGPEYIAELFKELMDLAKTNKENQQYVSPSFTITVTYTP